MLEVVSKIALRLLFGGTALFAATKKPLTSFLFPVIPLYYLVFTFAWGCEREPFTSGLALNYETNCSFCHGNENNAAPPLSLEGSNNRNDIGVGAHQAHLRNESIAKAVACEACHIVPETVDEPGHLVEGSGDKSAEVVFGELARTANSRPTWNRETARCTNTYCHGASLSGGKQIEPVWTETDESQIDCDACHDSPPPAPHIQRVEVSSCMNCHPDTVDENGDIKISEERHINGKIETATECYTCHGREGENDAPPFALDGSEETSVRAVGAHQSHLRDGANAEAIGCDQCHVVPESVDDPNHLPEGPDDLHAEVIFGELARFENFEPSWNRETGRCTNTYCHGATLTGGKHVEPLWTQVDGSQVDCDGCHGDPPPLPHPQGPRASYCTNCHSDTVDQAGDIKVSDGKHINGVIDAKTECYSCHGKEGGNEAPPFALDGSEETGKIGVGAHQSHLQGGAIAKAVDCEQCHIVPEAVDDSNHLADGPDDTYAEVTFGALASSKNLEPSWNRETARCIDTYCHGATLADGNHSEPIWIRVDESQIDCDGCHGNPPGSPHPQGLRASDCASCHPDTVNQNGDIRVSNGKHINGVIDGRTECYSCHGKEGVNEAPPFALDGSEDTDEISVGAHQSHLQKGAISNAVDCEQCHIVPETVDDPGHLPEDPDDTHAEVVFGQLATNGGMKPDFDRGAARCTNTYCHGATLTGGNHTEPLWTRVDKSQIACDSCHGNPPPPPHFQGVRASNCGTCHPNTVDENGDIRLSGGRHIDGQVDAVFDCYSCHGKEGINIAPPFALNGSEDTSEIGVGAHQSHVQQGTIAEAIQCDACHVVPEKLQDPGHRTQDLNDTHAEVVFGELASMAPIDPIWDRDTARCFNVYCHGTTLSGGNQVEPIWTSVDQNPTACDACHGDPPPAPHLQGVWVEDCATCHPDTVDADGNVRVSSGRHLNGISDVTITCDKCHGRANVNAAPPYALDRSEDTSHIGVGAHQSHVQQGAIATAIPCETCHIVPDNVDDLNHFDEGSDNVAEVVFSGLANNDDLAPIWDRTNARCTNTYCHGTTLTGGDNLEPVWTLVDGSQSGCDSCHGFPPPSPHINNPICSICHSSTVISGQTIDLSSGTHIDGEINVD